MLHSKAGAEDAAQTVFLKALLHEKTLARFTPPQLRAWLFRTVRNECLDALKKLRREFLSAEPWAGPDVVPLPETLLLEKQAKEALLCALDQLPDKYRIPIYWYYFAEIPQKEIARALGVKENTLRSLLRRAKILLNKSIVQNGKGGGGDG